VNVRYELHRFFWRAVDYLYPPICAGCKKQNYRLCPECLNQIQLINFHFCASCGKKISIKRVVCNGCAETPVFFKAVSSWGKYEGALREAIHSLKYKNNLGLGDFFGNQMIQLLKELDWDFNMVVPVPISKERLKERSYNQSALISRPIARYFKCEHSSNALTRTKDTGSQIQRSRIDRNLALEGAFCANPAKLKGRNVLLVDDIITTGATVNHCAAALLQAGAKEVYAISIAKTFPHDSKNFVQVS
jgi:competence protein ComFC